MSHADPSDADPPPPTYRHVRVDAFGPASTMRVTESPIPVPSDGEVLIRVRAAGVNPVDTYVRAGQYAVKPSLPYTPGVEGAGEVQVSNHATLSPGERVFFVGTAAGHVVGGYAEYALCRAEQVFRLPGRVSFERGAGIGVAYGTAWRAIVDRGGFDPQNGLRDQRVLVHGGGGGVGLAAIGLARRAGGQVLATASTDAGRDACLVAGADAVYDHQSVDYVDEIQADAPDGIDLILEMRADLNLDTDLSLLSEHGRVVVIGSRGRTEIDPRQTMAKEATVTGVMLWGGGYERLRAAFDDVTRGLADGSIVPHVVDVRPLVDAPAAHEATISSGRVGRIVLKL